LQVYNTPGKLRNFCYSLEEVEAQAAGRALAVDLEALAEVAAAIQPLTAYLGVALAVPPEDILMALTQGGMPYTVQELLSRFRTFVDRRSRAKTPTRCGLW